MLERCCKFRCMLHVRLAFEIRKWLDQATESAHVTAIPGRVERVLPGKSPLTSYSGLMKTSGIANNIVIVLKNYQNHGPVPLDFLAEAVGRRTPEILESVQRLETAGVIKRQNNKVELVK
jgi:predicted transcriptional regulator